MYARKDSKPSTIIYKLLTIPYLFLCDIEMLAWFVYDVYSNSNVKNILLYAGGAHTTHITDILSAIGLMDKVFHRKKDADISHYKVNIDEFVHCLGFDCTYKLLSFYEIFGEGFLNMQLSNSIIGNMQHIVQPQHEEDRKIILNAANPIPNKYEIIAFIFAIMDYTKSTESKEILVNLIKHSLILKCEKEYYIKHIINEKNYNKIMEITGIHTQKQETQFRISEAIRAAHTNDSAEAENYLNNNIKQPTQQIMQMLYPVVDNNIASDTTISGVNLYEKSAEEIDKMKQDIATYQYLAPKRIIFTEGFDEQKVNLRDSITRDAMLKRVEPYTDHEINLLLCEYQSGPYSYYGFLTMIFLGYKSLEDCENNIAQMDLHLLYSIIHTNNKMTIINRLLDLGTSRSRKLIEPTVMGGDLDNKIQVINAFGFPNLCIILLVIIFIVILFHIYENYNRNSIYSNYTSCAQHNGQYYCNRIAI
jgi:hypothetical protein